MRVNHIYTFLLFLAFCSNLNSQTPSFNFQKLGSEEGLNNANIFNIEQHRNGLMYFTTQNGVYFYDGYNFSKLEIDSLKSNALLNAAIGDKNELHLSIRDEGIARYDIRSKKFEWPVALRYKNNNADNIIVTDNFAYLLTSEIKTLIIDLKSGKVIEDEQKKANNQNLANCIFRTKEGRVLIGRSNGLYEATSGKQIQLDVLRNERIYSISQNRQGSLLVGTESKIFILNQNGIEREIIPVYKTKSTTFNVGGEKNINKVLSDDFGRIWFTSYPGENLYLYENNNLYDAFALLNIPPALINCVYMDSRQNIWVGTYSDGVYFIQNPFFNSINFSYNDKNLNINQVYLKGNLLVAATSNGLYGLNVTNNQTRTLSQPDEIFLEPVNSITPIDGILYYSKRSQFNMAPAMFFDSKNVYKFKPVIARQFYPINDGKSVVADWEANILLCNADGSKTLDTLISFSDYRLSVNTFLKLDNLLYIGTSNGLYRYDFSSKKYENLVRNELNYNINDLAFFGSKLYAAHEAGITSVYEGKLIQQIGKFRLNTVKKIKKFNEQIWLATLDGVFICDQNFEPLKTLNKSNGLLSNSVNDITFNEKTVSIATARGVSTTEYKNILRYNAKLSPVTISHIVCNGATFESFDNNYLFDATQEHITVFFYSPLFSKPNKQYFRYKIDGSEWKYFNNLSIDLSLTGGTHRIEISASADNITWSDSSVSRIVKEQKLSENQAIYWIISLGGLFVIVLISFIWIRRVKVKAKKRLRDEQQVNLLKHQAMNSLLSPHFIFNSLTSIQNYINTNNSLRASEYLAKFSRLIRMIIEKAAQGDITLHDELARLTYYLELEKERFKNKFDYVIKIDDNINTHEVQIPNMIIQPYVENCIIHGILPKQAHGELIISFKKSGKDKFLITIEDNGIGLIQAAEHAKAGHKSLGTSTIRNILEINSKLSGKNQTVTMTDKSTLNPAGQGTIISIELEL